MHAPWLISLAAGLVVGGLSQVSRLCTIGGFRDLFLFKKSILIFGYLAVLIGVFVVNISFGNFHLGFENQPIAHTDGLWNFLGMALAGFCSVLLGGCPLRQLIMTGEGNSDSAVTVLGLAAGAAFAPIVVLIIAIILGIILYRGKFNVKEVCTAGITNGLNALMVTSCISWVSGSR